MSAMKSKVFIDKLVDVAKNHKTLYVIGCFGAPMNATNKNRYINNGAHNNYNAQASRKAMINAASSDTFGFDCVCLIKGILWGWFGDASKIYGGAIYTSNGVPDIGADQMIKVCTGVSTTGWDTMVPGEAVWCAGHIGVYIGNGLAVECTPRWSNNVQITAVGNIGNKAGYNARVWTKHGKLPYIDYSDQTVAATTPDTSNTATTTVSGTVSTGSAADEKSMYDYLLSKIGNAFGVAGLMGNLYAESGLRSNNLQNTFEKKLGYTDASYTEAVDNGKYKNFGKDSAGYGLAQWTYWSRKDNLLKYAKSVKKSIGDWKMQCDFLMKEMSESYAAVLKVLKNATSVREASDVVLLKFERPANQSESVQKKRAEYGQNYYNKYAKSTTTTTTPSGTTTNTATDLKVGAIVNFIGTKHFSSANATSGPACKPGKAKITQIYAKGKHPYHLVAISGGGSNVYGWVDAKDIAEAVSVSNENALPRNVRVTATALNVRTGPGTTYKVAQCIRDRGVYQIVEEKNGWGRLNTGGWISLQYTKNV